MKRAILARSLACGWFLAAIAAAEQVELTTYYPAPFGVYDKLVAEQFVDYDSGTYHLTPTVGDWLLDPDANNGAGNVSATLLGRVGIGTSAPAVGTKVDVTGTETVGLRYAKTGAKDARLMIADPTRAWSVASGWGAAGDFSVIEEGVAGDRLYIQKATGNVGIGTAAPGHRLQVVQGGAGITQVGILSPDNQAGIALYSNNAGPTLLYSPSGTDDMRIWAGGADRMSVRADGLTTVGSASSSQPLPAPKSAFALEVTAAGGAGRDVNAWDYYVDRVNKWVGDGIDATQGGDGDWQVSGSNMYPTNLARNVGIGTSTPSSKLHVVGTTRSQGDLTVDTGSGVTLDGVYRKKWPAINWATIGEEWTQWIGNGCVTRSYGAGFPVVFATMAIADQRSAGGTWFNFVIDNVTWSGSTVSVKYCFSGGGVNLLIRVRGFAVGPPPT